MELVGVSDHRAGIEREPTLSALRRRPRVPRDRQRLQSAARLLDQVLLQRPHTERVTDVEVVVPSVGPLGVDDESVAASKERRDDPTVRERAAVEPAEDGAGAGVLHRDRVLRRLP
jgi:hypothetical protein